MRSKWKHQLKSQKIRLQPEAETRRQTGTRPAWAINLTSAQFLKSLLSIVIGPFTRASYLAPLSLGPSDGRKQLNGRICVDGRASRLPLNDEALGPFRHELKPDRASSNHRHFTLCVWSMTRGAIHGLPRVMFKLEKREMKEWEMRQRDNPRLSDTGQIFDVYQAQSIYFPAHPISKLERVSVAPSMGHDKV